MRYEPASSNPTATGCQPGTRALATAVRNVYVDLQCLTNVYGCYNRRRSRDAPSWSLHAEGRAFDVGVPGPEHETGWALACELVANRVLYGVQRVIWDGHIWSIEHADQWRGLQPNSTQHHDHIHVEQYRSAAARPMSYQRTYEATLRTSRLQHAAGA